MTESLSKAIREGRGHKVIGKIISDLIAYIERHFKREEDLFKKAKFNDADAHCQKHREIEKVVRDIANRYLVDTKSVDSHEFLMFLEKWLVQHIMRSDMEYVPSIRQSGKRG